MDDWTYEIKKVDDRDPTLEKVPFGVDLMPGVIVGKGEHRFTVTVRPHAIKMDDLPKGAQFPHTVQFTAIAAGGKAYAIVGASADGPFLVTIER